jgi:hypothetical protein
VIVLASVAIAAAIGYLVGVRGFWLVAFTAIAFIPIGMAVVLFVHRRAQPNVRLHVTNE